MSSKTHKHNKRRNSLLLYEFLVRTVSGALVEGDKQKSSEALRILRRFYKPGTQLYKEFRLMNSLVKTTVSSDHVAATILKEARSAATSIDVDSLDREKSLLIKSINYNLRDDSFYDHQISEYRNYATIQSLINEWRSNDRDLILLAEYEDHLMKMLLSPKEQPIDHVISEDSSGTARLLMKVMTKKLNEKYQNLLNGKQREIVRSYALSSANDDPTIISRKLAEVRDELLPLLESMIENASTGEFLKNKLVETKEQILSESFSEVNDDTITRFMLYSRLHDELESKE